MSTGESLDSTSHLTIRSPFAQYISQELTPIQVHVSRRPLGGAGGFYVADQ